MNDDNKNLRPFRGQFMDMIHPSSDMSVTDKPNYASEHSSQTPPAEPKPESKSELKSESESAPAAIELIDETLFFEDEDFGDELLEIFEPVKTKTAPQPDSKSGNGKKSDDSAKKDSYDSPFLPDVEVEKRPLGTPSPVADWIREFTETQPLNAPANATDYFHQAPEFFANQKILSTDDGGKGESESTVSADDENNRDNQSGIVEPESKPSAISETELKTEPETESENLPSADHLPRRNAEVKPNFDKRAAIMSTMSASSRRISETAQLTDSRAASDRGADAAKPPEKRHIWMWIFLFLFFAIAGAAAGALVYVSGWLR